MTVVGQAVVALPQVLRAEFVDLAGILGMSVCPRWWSCLGLVWLATAGCSHFVESRAIERFADRLHEEDLRGLKETSSPRFSEKALRTASAIENLQILRIPDGKVSIVEVDEVSDTRRRVTVRVGDGKSKDSKTEVFYELVKEDSGKWVVDDLYLKQRKQGVTAYKSLTEQMDLLISVREFLDAWDMGDREKALDVAAPEFRQALDRLPPAYFAQLTKQVLGNLDPDKSFRPQAQIDDGVAIVRLPRALGETVLTLKLAKDHWHVTDVAIAAKKEEDSVPSVRKQAVAVGACTEFLEAYQHGDHERLQKVCDKALYEGSLAVGDLKQVLLPSAQLTDHELEVQLRSQRADFLLRGEHELVQIDMRREDPADPNAPPSFYVRDVTIYELESKQEKRLSALFTAQEMLSLFCRALAERDLDRLRHCSTQDFSSRVWQRLNQATVQGLPLELFDELPAKPESLEFQGALTRAAVRQNGVAITYLLRDEGGRFFVDDIQWQVAGRPNSVKQTLELMVPIKNFAAAVALGRHPEEQRAAIEILQGSCTSDFNRLVWGQTEFVPNAGLSADAFLTAPLQSMSQAEDKVLVRLGDDRYGAEVRLIQEHGRLLVDEIQLIAGPEPQQRVEMKTTLRNVLAQGTAVRPEPFAAVAPRPRALPPVKNAQPLPLPTPSAVQPAVHTTTAAKPQAWWDEQDTVALPPIGGQKEP